MDSQPCDPTLQLLIILPKELKFLVTAEYHFIFKKLSHLYPDPFEYHVDMLYKTKHWQKVPMLPELSFKEIKKEYQTIDNMELQVPSEHKVDLIETSLSSDVNNLNSITVEIFPLLQKTIQIQNHWDYITEVVFHVYCIAVFEIMFYFQYAVLIEKDQMKMLINSFAKNTQKILENSNVDAKDFH